MSATDFEKARLLTSERGMKVAEDILEDQAATKQMKSDKSEQINTKPATKTHNPKATPKVNRQVEKLFIISRNALSQIKLQPKNITRKLDSWNKHPVLLLEIDLGSEIIKIGFLLPETDVKGAIQAKSCTVVLQNTTDSEPSEVARRFLRSLEKVL